MTRVAVATIAFLVIWAVFTSVFAASANKSEVRLLPKWLWVLLCVLVPFFGGLLYLMVGRPLRPQTRGFGGRGKVVAPDDDPNFLRDLSRRMKQNQKPTTPPKDAATEPKADPETEPNEDQKDEGK
jgi:hypothetical protein